jgi:large subunit ribosomal protein L19
MKALTRVERDHLKKKVARFSVGDTVKVHVKVMEGDKVRNQIFQGTVIGRRGGGLRETFVVRKISSGIAVERIFPLHSPSVTRIQVVRQGRVRRAQLTYMRGRKGKRARVSGLRGESADAKAKAKTAAAPSADGEGETPPSPEPEEEAKEEAAEAVES